MSGATVLYIDDEPLNVKVFVMMFKHEHTVLHAFSGEEALALLASSPVPPDIVICDLCMPGIDGLTTLTRVKKLFPDMPCYLLTGYEITDELREAHRCGTVAGFFPKPSVYEDLAAVLKKACA
jgi:CheY-like chemotaxis protein